MHPLRLLPWFQRWGSAPRARPVRVCTSSVSLGSIPLLQLSPAPSSAPAPLPRGPALAPASPTLAGSPRPLPWFSDTRPYPASADLLHAVTAMPSSACQPQGEHGAAAPPCTLAGQLHPATASHARSAWTPPPQPSPPRAPPRRRLRPSAGSAVSPPPQPGWGPAFHELTLRTRRHPLPAARSLTDTHSASRGPLTSQGFSCLYIQGCLSWGLISGEKTRLQGKTLATFLRLVKRAPPLLSQAPKRSLAKGTRKLGGRADLLAQMAVGHLERLRALQTYPRIAEHREALCRSTG